MRVPKQTKNPLTAKASDIQRLIGDRDASIVTAIMALAPSIAELEEAALWLAGEGETLAARHQPRSNVTAILDLLTADEDEDGRER